MLQPSGWTWLFWNGAGLTWFFNKQRTVKGTFYLGGHSYIHKVSSHFMFKDDYILNSYTSEFLLKYKRIVEWIHLRKKCWMKESKNHYYYLLSPFNRSNTKKRKKNKTREYKARLATSKTNFVLRGMRIYYADEPQYCRSTSTWFFD